MRQRREGIFRAFSVDVETKATMPDPKGYKLFVNVGASQARRRLKGFGHGVRKVQSAGRNQAVLVHTATGRHLLELQAKFADVGFSTTERGLSEPIVNLLNLGAARAAWLHEVGIHTVSDLERIGPIAAFRLVQQRQPKVGIALLWAMVAGLQNRDLSIEEETLLRQQISENLES